MFSRLTGNDRVKQSLRGMLRSHRLPGAMLFVGDEGIGKKLFALEVAKSLNCRTRVDEVEACDVCASCTRINNSKFPSLKSVEDNKERMIWSNHTDVGLVRPYNRLIRIDPMRQLDREANFRPYEGNARIFIIEDADRMNDASSSALLKTLEEPPETTHLILITSRPASLLSTIRSRCQAVRFVPLSTSDIGNYLLEHEESISEDDARVRARAASGSLGRALSVDLASYLEQRNAMLEIVDALTITKDRACLLRAAEALCDAKRKDEYEPQLGLLETLLHDVWTLSLSASGDGLANDDLREHLSQVVTHVESSRVARWLTQIEKHRGTLDVNINRKVATDALFLKMAEGPTS